MVVDARRCSARRRDGQPCSGRAVTTNGEQPVCFAHDATRQEALKASRLAGGHGRSTASRSAKHLPPELRTVQTALLELVDEVRKGTAAPQEASAVAALAGRLLDLARFSLETGEQATLEARLTALEAALARTGRWA